MIILMILLLETGELQDAGVLVTLMLLQSTIDTLIANLNDIIAPTGADFNIAADRLYFNREYLAQEVNRSHFCRVHLILLMVLTIMRLHSDVSASNRT